MSDEEMNNVDFTAIGFDQMISPDDFVDLQGINAVPVILEGSDILNTQACDLTELISPVNSYGEAKFIHREEKPREVIPIGYEVLQEASTSNRHFDPQPTTSTSKNHNLRARSEKKQNNDESIKWHRSSNGKSKENKRPRTNNIPTQKNVKNRKKNKPNNKENHCNECCQHLDSLKVYSGHPNNALDQYPAMFDSRVQLKFQTDDPDETNPGFKITDYSFYCKEKHLCRFDTGLIESDVHIFMSGYTNAIWCDNPSIENSVPTKDIGPISAWYVMGFDGSQDAVISVNTDSSEYYLIQPSDQYSSFMKQVKEKAFLSKSVIEILLEDPESEYEDLLAKLDMIPSPNGISKLTENVLTEHTQFIVDQILSFDESADEGDVKLIYAPCIKMLIDSPGVIVNKNSKKAGRKISQKNDGDWNAMTRSSYKQKKLSLTKATTTAFVDKFFDNFFPDQEKNTSDKLVLKRRRCGTCEACLEVDCGKCASCKDKPRFGGPGTSKQACLKRRCPNMEVIDSIDVEDENYDEISESTKDTESSTDIHRKFCSSFKKKAHDSIEWIGEPLEGIFFSAIKLDSEVIEKDDYIFIMPEDSSMPIQVMKVRYMWESSKGDKMFHGTWLWRGSGTILAETAHPNELFMVDQCQDVPLIYVQQKAKVFKYDSSKHFGNNTASIQEDEIFYRKRYDPIQARFEDLPKTELFEDVPNCCPTCLKGAQKNLPKPIDKEIEKGIVEYASFTLHNEEIKVGSGVYLKPNTFSFKHNNKCDQVEPVEIADAATYPELYRKSNNLIKGSNFDIVEPFNVGYVTRIYSKTQPQRVRKENLFLEVKKMYRLENTKSPVHNRDDLNKLYWSDEVCTVKQEQITGKCYLMNSENLEEGTDCDKWSSLGPNRFYFTHAYDSIDDKVVDLPDHTLGIGLIYTKNKTSKSKSIRAVKKDLDEPIAHAPISNKLRTFDIFAGCGGLSEGLKQSGLTKNLWAIEQDEAAAHAYRLNNSETKVFTMDCNQFLKKVLSGETVVNSLPVPKPGEVDLLCGGPPCQRLSGMNGFNRKSYSSIKNSLIVSLLSFCDYYRPRFFIMENARNFVSYKNSSVLKLTISCLVRMGYQCTFGILQAGSYGVPQTRRRFILIAAAPGEILPNIPRPLHAFSKSACELSMVIDNVKYSTFDESLTSGPFRAITVQDALSDLPPIISGANEITMTYSNDSQTHFQKMMRASMKNSSLLMDHICKDLGPLANKRMSYIPLRSGSDWRDLPNIVVQLSDGSLTNKLYKNIILLRGKGTAETLRGVCSCVDKNESCQPKYRQANTLIPWCLPHTADKNNQWGPVLHPEQHRVVSVRECARSQGFPDNFQFYGNILEKHRQIGNAVPPPLAKAVGLEIRKSVSLKEAFLKNV
uniref:DNA (cytosine-5)-methyltransferase n=1 Tax=Trichogramma kaykai TaxID=54128 RepID=A0ABD2X5D8_9HYME